MMSSGFSFGAKPAEAPAFGQTPIFGTQPQQLGASTFGAPASNNPNANVLPQFTSSFGGGTSTGFQMPSAPATTTVAGFGTPTFSFNPPATQSALKPPGIPFSSPASNPNPGGISFGTPLTTPGHNLFSTSAAATAPNTGLTFGTPKATLPTMGLSFNTPTTAQPPAAVPGFGVAAPSMPVSSMFGTPNAPSPGFGLSIPTVTRAGTTGANFGTTPATTGISFGTAIPTSSIPLPSGPNKGLTFGVAPTMAATASAFGPSALQPGTTNLNFTTQASSAPTTGLSFNVAKSTPSTGLTFGTPTTLTFGVSSAAPTPAPTFSTAVTAGLGLASAPSGATGLSFLTPTTTKATTAATLISAAPLVPSTAGAAINFASNLVSSAVTTSDLGGASMLKIPAPTTSAATFSLLPQPPPTTATVTSAPQTTIGLGGINAGPPKQPTGTTNITTEQAEVAPRDQVLPNELLQTVEQFKKFVQEQKSFSSEISRFSLKELKKVENDIDLVNNSISEMESDLQKNKAVAEKLKYDTAKGLQYVEMAQRTFDTPSGLQYDNTTPLNYFIELCDHFEKDMYDLKLHIENIDKCIRHSGPPAALTSQDLALGMRRLHETFVALAGRLQSVHSQVEFQKEQYLNLRKQILNDYTNVFEGRSKELEALEIALDSIPSQPPAVFTGPTPFSSLGNSQAQALAQNPPPSYPGTTPLGVPAAGFGVGGTNTMPLFGSGGTGATMFNTSSAFQLQKPPIGNKRGKP